MFGPDCNKCGGVFPGHPNGNGLRFCRCQTPLETEREAAFEKAMTPLEDPSAKFEAAMKAMAAKLEEEESNNTGPETDQKE